MLNFFFQAEDGIRDQPRSRGLGDVYKRQDASKLKMFNVVVGSFTIKTNASNLQESLVADGYNAFLAQNAKGMYRVIVGSFDDRPSATELRESVKAKYPNRFSDAWLLINE